MINYKFFAFMLMFLGVLLFSIFATYSPLEASLNSTAFIVDNHWLYAIRNYTADLLLQIFGKSIYIVPLALVLYSYFVFNNITIKNPSIKTFCVIVFLITAPISVYTYINPYSAGLIGYFISINLPLPSVVNPLILLLNIVLIFLIFNKTIAFYLTTLKRIKLVVSSALASFKAKIYNTLNKTNNNNKVIVTPDINYINQDINNNSEIVNLKDYEEKHKEILKNNLFLQPLNQLNAKYSNANKPADTQNYNNLNQNTNSFEQDTNNIANQNFNHNQANTNEHNQYNEYNEPSETTETQHANNPAVENIDINRPTGKELNKSTVANISNAFKNYSIPLNLLKLPAVALADVSKAEITKQATNLEKVMKEFGILGKIVNIVVGPVVTMYEITIPAGMKTTKLTSLETDIALRMSALSVRIAVIPGKDVIGIELPNASRKTIYLKEILQSAAFSKANQQLPITLGLDTSGKPIIEDLSTMPHCLIAGTTGSGKSVGINTIILSLLYKFSPEKCKLIMIDPKMLELSVYQDIPHLITPVVTDPKKAVAALKWAVKEMDHRYYLMSLLGVRNVIGYNEKIKDTNFINQKLNDLPEDQQGLIEFNFMPYVAVIIDEMADLMLVAGKDVEIAVQRLAQKARAAGIHLIMATQRPSTDVITGTIKANFPTRISFKVSSSIDSRTILNSNGAEQLLGKGDMLYLSGMGLKRVHGPFVSDDEVVLVADYLKAMGKPNYVEDVISSPIASNDFGADDEDEELVQKAIEVIQLTGKVSVSHLQNKLRIGFNKSTRLMDLLEAKGIVGPDKGAGKRDIFIK